MDIIKSNLIPLSAHIPHTEAELHVFLFCVHDWMAHMVDEPYWWNQYGTTIGEVACQQVTPPDSLTYRWMKTTINTPLTIGSLLYRHYLIDDVTSTEILATPTYTPLYTLIASMLTDVTVFAPLHEPRLWEGIDEALHPINVLRQKRTLIRRYRYMLAMREDTTDHQLFRDHGLLSSLSLLYGLYLTQVILIYEKSVRPNAHIQTIYESISHTLIQLKGVFQHVESSWLSLDV